MFNNKNSEPKRIDLTYQEINNLRLQLESCDLPELSKSLMLLLFDSFFWFQDKLERGKLTIHKLKKIFLGGFTERRKKKKEKEKEKENKNESDLKLVPIEGKGIALSNDADNQSHEEKEEKEEKEIKEKKIKKGHGRLGSDDYEVDRIETLSHELLKSGDNCPELLCTGKLYFSEPGIFIRLIGQRPVEVVRYVLEKLRCNLCGILIKAELPENFNPKEKYDAYFKSNLAVQKYFMASPFYRQEKYYDMIKLPLSDSTQYELVESVADCSYKVMGVLEELMANAKVVHNDDTRVKILSVMRDNQENPDKKRTGMFTSCIYGESNGNLISLYYSGIEHAGENLSLILKKRELSLSPVIQMCDALSANLTPDHEVIVCHCLSHARRRFVEIEPFFPEECRIILDKIGLIYQHEKTIKEKLLSPDERLFYHQLHSQPVMDKLKDWMKQKIDSHEIEPNSGLGQAVRYVQKHWIALTKFLSVAHAPLDNNIVERSLKIPIRSRKNSLFHKTAHGAKIASILTSLIYTCYLAKKNSVDYLTTLQNYKNCVFKKPSDWLPWNYEQTVQQLNYVESQKVA